MQTLTWRVWIHCLVFRLWQSSLTALVLSPLSFIYSTVHFVKLYLKKPVKFPTKTLVVGNNVLGGSGKTPLVIEIASLFTSQGYSVGIISRGYMRQTIGKRSYLSTHYPGVQFLGDEGALVAHKTGCPVVSGPDRVQSMKILLKYHQPDIVIFDDGLSSRQVHFDFKIALLGDIVQYGNGAHLPAGPLRHSLSYYKGCDLLLNQAYSSSKDRFFKKVTSNTVYNAADRDKKKDLRDFDSIYCATGIAMPELLYQELKTQVDVELYVLADHQPLTYRVLKKLVDQKPVVISEKDWVKIEKEPLFNSLLKDIWVLSVRAELSEEFKKRLLKFAHTEDKLSESVS